MSLDALPTELLLQIFTSLSIGDVLNTRCACRVLSEVTRERGVWHDALLHHVVRRNIPVHGLNNRHVSDLSSSELEYITLHALRCRRNWISPNPKSTRITEIAPIDLYEDLENARTWASYFVPGSDGRYLISFTRTEGHTGQHQYILQCWDIHASPPARVARLLLANMLGLQVNSESEYDAVLAVTCRSPENKIQTNVYTLEPYLLFPDMGFRLVRSFESSSTPLKLSGSLFFSTNESNRIKVYDANTGELKYTLRVPLHLNDATIFLEEHRCLAIHATPTYILTFCQQWTHLYTLPELSAISASGTPELDPTSAHRWPYRIDTLKLSAARAHPLHSAFTSSPPAQPLHILLRYDSWFPWPVNILHHYILPLPSSSAAPTLAPYLAASFPSPVRLFSPTSLLLGPFDTALWLDAAGPGAAPGQAADRGQRIAGTVLGYPPPSEVEGEAPRRAADLQAAGAGENEVAVFMAQEEREEWWRVGIDDNEGRLAVSCVDGRVMVYDYVWTDE